jgi:hypothetical protein
VVIGRRAAEILLIHALRAWVESPEGAKSPGLCALADPAIGTALPLIHGRPGESWTVERLASDTHFRPGVAEAAYWLVSVSTGVRLWGENDHAALRARALRNPRGGV